MRAPRLGMGASATVALLLAADAGAQTTPPPPSVKLLLDRARTELERKNTPAAIESLRKARDLAPNSEEVLVAFADAALAARTPLPAVAALDALVRLAPTVAAYRYRLGRTCLELGDAEAAAAALQEADRLEPSQEPTLAALGVALNRRGLYADAEPVLLRAASLDPDAVDVQGALAEAEEARGERVAAEARVERVLLRAGTDGTANRVLGALRLKQDRLPEARDALLKAATAEPDSPFVHERLAVVYAKLNDPILAKKHEDRARLAEKRRAARVRESRRLTGFAPEEARP